MIRKAFVMSVYPGKENVYKKRHNPIWHELAETLREHGVRNYSIFLDPENNQLFGFVEIEDDRQWTAISTTDACQRWWAYMKDIMPSNPDNSPVSRDLWEVFHLN